MLFSSSLFLIFFSFFIFLSSCSVGPPFRSPSVDSPFQWKNRQKSFYQKDFCYLDYWWQVFDDEKLNALEALALENNKELLLAFERIQEADALKGIAAADFYPQATFNPHFMNTASLIKKETDGGINQANKNTKKTATSLKEASRTSLSNSTSNNIFRLQEGFYLLPFNLSYQVDLWGKIKDHYDSYKYNWKAQQKDYEFVMLNLTANLAITYYQLRTLDSQLDFLKKVILTRQKAFNINKDRYEEQITNYGEVAVAGEEFTSAQGEYDERERQRKVLENQLAILVGIPSSEFSLKFSPLQGIPPCIPSGIPSEVLLRRPDLSAANYIIGSQYMSMKEAYAQFFPSLTLTATLGFESPLLKYFLSWMSRYWSNTTAVDQVVFDGFRTYYHLKQQIAQFREASFDYQQKVLVAFQEVENALANLNSYAEQYKTAQATVQWSKKAHQLYSDRYKQGVTYYIEVANTERDLLNFQISANSIQGQRFIATVQLIQALGGGWKNEIDL